MPASPPRQPYVPQVVVVGGGCSGAAFAIHLARHVRRTVDVAIVEPREVVGAGVAYSTIDPAHRINVPASRMSLFSQDEGHFDRWLRSSGELLDDPGASAWAGELFPRRVAFGRYVNDVLAQAAATGSARVGHVRDKAVSVIATDAGYVVRCAAGRDLTADLVVLATSHPPPTVPDRVAEALHAETRLVIDPWRHDALECIGETDDVLVIGTGLTMADVVASLDARGHNGKITAVSRRGQRSRGHSPQARQACHDLGFRPPSTVRALVAEARSAIAIEEARGGTWHAVVDMLRRHGPDLWRALPEAERRRFLRHVRPFWDTHRYRVAPQVEGVLLRRIAAGTLDVMAGSLDVVAASASRIEVAIRRRGRSGQPPTNLAVNAIVVTTGPSHADAVQRLAPLASLAAAGRIRSDPHRLGVQVDGLSRAIGDASIPDSRLLVVGPLARAQFGELMGLPEIAVHAERVAQRAAEWLEHRLTA